MGRQQDRGKCSNAGKRRNACPSAYRDGRGQQKTAHETAPLTRHIEQGSRRSMLEYAGAKEPEAAEALVADPEQSCDGAWPERGSVCSSGLARGVDQKR